MEMKIDKLDIVLITGAGLSIIAIAYSLFLIL